MKKDSVHNFLQLRDIKALKSIYEHRCLTVNQIYRLHYRYSTKDQSQEVSDSYCKKKINEFLTFELVEKINHYNREVFFLTTKGIDIVKYYFDFPGSIYDYRKKTIKKGYYRAYELKISPKYINHQLELNDFLIRFKEAEKNIGYRYYDEKHISDFTGIRPDGLLRMLDIDFFLEMDMATESKKQLWEKWDNYRRFLNSKEFYEKQRKIIVLFIVENTKNPKKRIDLIKHTLAGRLMDRIDDDFDILIDTGDNIISQLGEMIDNPISKERPFSVKTKKAMEGFDFVLEDGLMFKQALKNIDYDFYCRKTDSKSNVVVENGKIQEFILDLYDYKPFSVLKKISFLSHNNIYYKEHLGREMSYIVVGNSEEDLYRDLKIMDLLVVDNVYLTTKERLETMELNKALFNFDFSGNIHHFLNMGLKEREFEENIEDLIERKMKEENELFFSHNTI